MIVLMLDSKFAFRKHEIHIKGNKVLAWFIHQNDDKFPLKRSPKKNEFKVYTDKKGDYIKLDLGTGDHKIKHYINGEE
ncbi:MAG: hypothetical protein O7C59_01510 [Rickettsia endosymbiont of Ixodes persulcatus]|nr:hypothetical protein [Rickettsia endosymbiont of Ixodes persulcatus]